MTSGEPIWPAQKTFHADGLTSYGYEEQLVLFSEISSDNRYSELRKDTKTTSDKVMVEVAVEWVLCKEECIPGQVTLNKAFTTADFAMSPSHIQLRNSTTQESENKGAPLTSISQATPSQAEQESVKYASAQIRGLPTIDSRSGNEFEKIGLSIEQGEESQGFLITLLMAFFGGILLNLMPCVFPVLSIKIMSFVNQTDSRSGLSHGGVFALGIVVSFWILSGLLFVLRALGAEVGWGFQFQSPTFVIVMGMVIFAVGLNFMGVFEIGHAAQRVASQADRGTGYWGSFFSGVLSTLLATPCSAPFMASAIAATMVLPIWRALLVFTSIGFGMSAPYVVLSAYPRLLGFLPKPGNWMVRLKQIMAFPMFATVIWLVWVLSLQVSGAGVVRFLVGVLCLSIGFWTLGQWYVPQAKLVHRRVAVLVFCLTVISAFSVALPGESDTKGSALISNDGQSNIVKAAYSEERLNQLLASNTPVLVEFSAAWCLTYQVNNLVLSRSEEVVQELKRRNVAMLVGDWTKRDPAITRAINALGRDRVPLNALYIPGKSSPIVLPQVVTPGGLLDALNQIPYPNT